MNNNLHVERAKYLLNNNLTIAEAAAILNIDTSTIRKSLKLAGPEWKRKTDAMLAWEKIISNPVKLKQITGKKNFIETIHEQRARYILCTNSIKNYNDVAEKLKLSICQVQYSILIVKKKDLFLYNKVKDVLKERNEVNLKIIKYISKNPKASRNTIKNKFNVSNSTISKALVELKLNSVDSYNEYKKILDINKNPLYRQYANYIIKYKVDIIKTAIHFKTSTNIINLGIKNLRLYDPILYKKTIETLNK